MARRFCPIFLMQPQLLLLLLLLLLLHLTSPAHARDISTISSKPSLPDFPPSAHQENAVTEECIYVLTSDRHSTHCRTSYGIREEKKVRQERRVLADKKPIDVTSPYFVSHSDNRGAALVPVVLNGQNYQSWAKATVRALEAKNKTGFIDGSLKQPDRMSPEFRLWKINNRMI
ncbi:hypothetical protein CRG98_026470 [Punica granatum]|uniref:Retrotransposon Copia-like N-terminal domain-containing protein n=1 Tax=Punica granatum TaxID=22663 RepID=A0A2I0JA77_PUNGR|nr:hypothetical protein CRG98_026470 [Punica granatum]